jgi:hypothetical protein
MNEPQMRRLDRREFEALTLEQRMTYLQALMADLRERLKETRRQAQRTGDRLRWLELERLYGLRLFRAGARQPDLHR